MNVNTIAKGREVDKKITNKTIKNNLDINKLSMNIMTSLVQLATDLVEKHAWLLLYS